MNQSFIPETAPFNEEQRAWLNGFFAGLAGMAAPGQVPTAMLSAATGLAVADQKPAEQAEEAFPWHDASLPIAERMNLADGKPLPRRLMAAMAQLDCGSCGYVCQTYAEAVAAGSETNLTLCSPGGKETKQMIKQVLQASDGAPAEPRSNGKPAAVAAGWSRQNPFSAKVIASTCLNRQGSAKDTRHVVIDLSGSGLEYEVGDALGLLPTNCEEVAAMIVRRLGADPHVTVTSPQGHAKPLLQALREDCCLKEPSDELIALLIDRVDATARNTLKRLLDEGAPEGMDVLDVLEIGRGAAVSGTEVIETLQPLNPRLYSIASSRKAVGNEVHLTVGKVAFEREGRLRKGVASTMLADRLKPGDPVQVFVQANHGGFTVPSDPQAPIIMVGPGTGIAPFIAFLQERAATHASGQNWLFFGDQHRALDFLYQEQLEAYRKAGLLTRLETAFSRDGETKIYVQDRMREHAAELWQWLEQGAYFFVCGDASRMALDVDRCLTQIIASQGNRSQQEAQQYVKRLAEQRRYVRDVY